MRFLVLLALLLSFVCAFGQDTKPDTSTPESTLQAFLKAWNASDSKGVNLILGVTLTPEIAQSLNAMTEQHIQLSGDEFQTIAQGDDAVVIYQLHSQASGAQPWSGPDMVQFKRTPDGWRIVAPKHKNGFSNGGFVGVGVLAEIMTDPEWVKKATKSAGRATCASNIRQCGLGMIMFASDWDDKMKVPPSQSEVRKALTPYMKNDKLFKCPDSGEYFSFNVKLAGVWFPSLEDPSQTIMFYEGSKGQLSFRHDGKANICFCDGHVKSVDPEEAKKLRWK